MKRVLFLFLVLAAFLLSGCTHLLPGTANRPPGIEIDAYPQQGPAPLTVVVNARHSGADGTIAEYHWDFGDSRSAASMSGANATHTYAYPGIYVIELITVNDKGKTNSERIVIKVKNPPPVASFSLTDDNPFVGSAVTFNASGSYDPNGEITSYTWDFGDGTSATGVEVTHPYGEAGYFVVTLTVTDDDGVTATYRDDLIVQEGSCDPGGGGCGGGPAIPLAVISGLPSCNGGRVGVSITLDGSFSRAAEGMIVSYEWDFGDGETGSGPQVSHTYQRAGRFIVTLTVTDDAGTKGEAIAAISISGS